MTEKQSFINNHTNNMTTKPQFTVRPATEAAPPTIMQLVKSAIQIMHNSGNTGQWKDGYPSEDVIMDDITSHTCYILMSEGKPVGSFALKPGPDPTYSKIYNGSWLNDKPYYVIHRVTSLPETHGTFAAVLNYSFGICSNIRIDTFCDNTIMRHLLEKHGFHYCGIIHVANGDERLAFHKI